MKLKTRYGQYLLAAALGLASAAGASAQILTLSSLTATFQNPIALGSGTIVNGAAVQTFSSAVVSPSVVLTNTISTLPIVFNVGPTTNFNTFSVLDTDKVSATASSFSSVDLKFDFNFVGGAPVDFSIVYKYTKTFENAEIFSYSLTPQIQSGNFLIGGSSYAYTIVSDGVTGTVGLGSQASLGQASLNMDISFTAVPEPSTYALFGVVALGGIVAYRRYRGQRNAPPAQLLLA